MTGTPNTKITLIEVGPRDGLENEKKLITAADKVKFIELLAASGFEEIEAGAFVSPKWVPQMADSEIIFDTIFKNANLNSQFPLYSALVPNDKGLEAALRSGVKKISVFTAASETFNQKNINCSIEDSFQRIAPVISAAKQKGLIVRGYVSTAFVCPYEGDITANQVNTVIQRLYDSGADEISIGDTIGKATTSQVKNLLDIVAKKIPVEKIAMHFHDTYNQALTNIGVSLNYGIKRYDSSTAGLGGCPYAAGAKGNVATELIVEFFEMQDHETGIDSEKLKEAKKFITEVLKT